MNQRSASRVQNIVRIRKSEFLNHSQQSHRLSSFFTRWSVKTN